MSLFPLFSFAFLHSSNISGLDAPTQKGATLPSYTSPLAADTTTPDFVAHAPNAHSYHSWPSRYGQLITVGSSFFFFDLFFFPGLFRILDLSKRAISDFPSAFPGFRDERGILEISATPPTEDERECMEAPVPQHACTFLEGGGRVEVNTTMERGG